MTSPANVGSVLYQTIPVFNSGYAFYNSTVTGLTQIKTGAGVFAGQSVNTVGTTSTNTVYDGTSATITVTIAAPGVVSWAGHGIPIGGSVQFTTTSALPTGISAGTTYFVSLTSYGPNSFVLSDTKAHALAGTNNVTTSGSQSGTQTGWNLTYPIGKFSTLAVNSLQIGAQLQLGLIINQAGGGAADLTMLYL